MPLPAGVYPAAELARVRSLPGSTTVPKQGRKAQGPSPARQASPENPAPAAPAGETNTAYFRRFFKKNRGLLKERSNDAALSRWLADHPGETEVPQSVKNILMNVKAQLRKKLRQRASR